MAGRDPFALAVKRDATDRRRVRQRLERPARAEDMQRLADGGGAHAGGSAGYNTQNKPSRGCTSQAC